MSKSDTSPAHEADRPDKGATGLWTPWPPTDVDGGTDPFVPCADIEETNDAYIIEIELPGLAKRDVTLEQSGSRTEFPAPTPSPCWCLEATRRAFPAETDLRILSKSQIFR